MRGSEGERSGERVNDDPPPNMTFIIPAYVTGNVRTLE